MSPRQVNSSTSWFYAYYDIIILVLQKKAILDLWAPFFPRMKSLIPAIEAPTRRYPSCLYNYHYLITLTLLHINLSQSTSVHCIYHKLNSIPSFSNYVATYFSQSDCCIILISQVTFFYICPAKYQKLGRFESESSKLHLLWFFYITIYHFKSIASIIHMTESTNISILRIFSVFSF